MDPKLKKLIDEVKGGDLERYLPWIVGVLAFVSGTLFGYAVHG